MATRRTAAALKAAVPDGGRHWHALALMLLAGIMMGVALAGLRTVADRGQEFSSPGRYNEVWQSYSLSRQVMNLAATADAVASGVEPPIRLKLRLGVMRTALLPLLKTQIFEELNAQRPQIQATLAHLDQTTRRWDRELSWQDVAASRRLAATIAADLSDEEPDLHALIVAANIAVATHSDRQRQALQRTFHWLSLALLLLAAGCALLALKIILDQRRARRLANDLHQLNLSLERRIQERTQALRDREALLQTILDSSPSDVTLIGADQQQVFYVSDSLLIQSGAEHASRFSLAALFVDPAEHARFVARLERGELIYQMEARLCPKAPYWALLNARQLQVGEQPAWLVWCFDITQRRRQQERLTRRADTDDLTGLSNRRALLKATVKHLRRRRDMALSVLLIDIDHFKRVNDAHGHDVGDEALRVVANQLRSAVRDPLLVGRVGGEEFAVVLPETPLAEAVTVAERLCRLVATTPLALASGPVLALTLSIGAAERRPRESLKQMMRRADRHLYQAKHSGRDRVVQSEG
ncbi:GGDEF domain-containing protein [Salinicola endophyticus]|uniref:diguanylate cyclase n=1 Tax=Salinicola endophyticus TaxID=1949083 RepID=A0ABY8FM90_9GAMM|nr:MULTISPECIES: GGDEF domain-containing protein [Salinicola]WFF41786.1 GGDEF domain-containing protein [Salinicola endophyticus]